MSHKYYGTWESTARDEKEGVINLQPELNGFFLLKSIQVCTVCNYNSEKQFFESSISLVIIWSTRIVIESLQHYYQEFIL